MTTKTIESAWWRLNNLYYIKDKYGKKRKFKANTTQKALYKDMWYLNIILKARQLGMTTMIQLFMLDRCLFNDNVNAGVIAHNREDAQKFFKDKIKFAYDSLPEEIKSVLKATNDSAGELSFSNGSSIRVGTSLRSGTYQYLHISEFGKLCAKFPERASEVVTGALNTVAAGQFIFIESTAEGAYGHFYDMCQTAINAVDLTKMDYKFWFFPWFDDPSYVLEDHVQSNDRLDAYFQRLKSQGIDLSQQQKSWYIKKEQEQRSKMKQEFPSTSDEAFEQVTEYAVYGKQIGEVLASGRHLDLPVNPNTPVDVFFDIGASAKNETTSVWFMQHIDPWFNFIDYYQSSLQEVGAYVRDIRARGYNLRTWYLPHDADHHDKDVKTFKTRLINAGVNEADIVVVPRVSELTVGIDQMREKFPSCRFDKTRCKSGWLALCSYKYEWNERKATMDRPIHNWASHPADAIRQFAQGYVPQADDSWYDGEINYPRSSLA